MGRFGFDTGLLQKAEVPNPIDKMGLLCTEPYAAAIREAACVATVAE